MTTTTPATRVQSYDWSRAAHLPEFHRLAEALDAFVHAARADELPMRQDEFLAMVRDVATGLGYADMCSNCYELAHPFAADVSDDGWSLRGAYRHCGRTWTCGYAVAAPEWFQ